MVAGGMGGFFQPVHDAAAVAAGAEDGRTVADAVMANTITATARRRYIAADCRRWGRCGQQPVGTVCRRTAILSELRGQRLCHPRSHADEGDDQLGQPSPATPVRPQPRARWRTDARRGGAGPAPLDAPGPPPRRALPDLARREA